MRNTGANIKCQKPKIWWIVTSSLILILIGVVFLFICNDASPKHLMLESWGILVCVLSLLGAFILSLVGYHRIQRCRGRRIEQLCSALCAILAVFIIATAALLPAPSDAPTHKRWWIGRIMAGTVATAIRVYAEEKGSDAEPPADNDFGALGIKAEDLDERYFNQTKNNMFSFTVHNLNPLKYTITVTNKYLEPSVMALDQDGNWTEIENKK